jgi:hypothetical protein
MSVWLDLQFTIPNGISIIGVVFGIMNSQIAAKGKQEG